MWSNVFKFTSFLDCLPAEVSKRGSPTFLSDHACVCVCQKIKKWARVYGNMAPKNVYKPKSDKCMKQTCNAPFWGDVGIKKWSPFSPTVSIFKCQKMALRITKQKQKGDQNGGLQVCFVHLSILGGFQANFVALLPYTRAQFWICHVWRQKSMKPTFFFGNDLEICHDKGICSKMDTLTCLPAKKGGLKYNPPFFAGHQPFAVISTLLQKSKHTSDYEYWTNTEILQDDNLVWTLEWAKYKVTYIWCHLFSLGTHLNSWSKVSKELSLYSESLSFDCQWFLPKLDCHSRPKCILCCHRRRGKSQSSPTPTSITPQLWPRPGKCICWWSFQNLPNFFSLVNDYEYITVLSSSLNFS